MGVCVFDPRTAPPPITSLIKEVMRKYVKVNIITVTFVKEMLKLPSHLLRRRWRSYRHICKGDEKVKLVTFTKMKISWVTFIKEMKIWGEIGSHS